MKTFKNIFSMAIPLVWLFILISPGGPDGLKLIYSADQCTNLYAVNADLTISHIYLPLVVR